MEKGKSEKKCLKCIFLFDDDSKHIIIIYDSSGGILLEGENTTEKKKRNEIIKRNKNPFQFGKGISSFLLLDLNSHNKKGKRKNI